jgi:hypothetical protein
MLLRGQVEALTVLGGLVAVASQRTGDLGVGPALAVPLADAARSRSVKRVALGARPSLRAVR